MASSPLATTVPSAEHFTQHQVDVLVGLERVGGTISLVAIVCIFIAYGLVPKVRNVQNTFIVFASVANVGASIASVIALDGMQKGKGTPLCQAQSFLFEMFMQSDPWWSLAMAVNVFLVFYFRASPDSFRRWWWVYCVICYGGPFVIALTLLLYKNSNKGPIYGDATIWCWVDSRWDSIRIYTYYMLIWICIAGSMICYTLVGFHVFRSRNRLRVFSGPHKREAGYCEKGLGNAKERPDGSYGLVTTEVRVVHTAASPNANAIAPPAPAQLPSAGSAGHAGQASFDSAASSEKSSTRAQYYSSVTSAAPRRQSIMFPLIGAWTKVRQAANKFVIDDPIKRAYLRTSLLFAISVLVTWIPSSLNRIHGWLAGSSPFEFHVAAAAVLPLQGLWNFLIFFSTSWKVVRQRCRAWRDGRSRRRTPQRSLATPNQPINRPWDRDRGSAQKDDDFHFDFDFEDDDADSGVAEAKLGGQHIGHDGRKTSASL